MRVRPVRLFETKRGKSQQHPADVSFVLLQHLMRCFIKQYDGLSLACYCEVQFLCAVTLSVSRSVSFRKRMCGQTQFKNGNGLA